jgi:hypothetical protein
VGRTAARRALASGRARARLYMVSEYADTQVGIWEERCGCNEGSSLLLLLLLLHQVVTDVSSAPRIYRVLKMSRPGSFLDERPT